MRTNRNNHNEFKQSIIVDAPIEKVLNMWFDPNLLKNWFVKDIQFVAKDSGEYSCTWDGGVIERGEIFYSKKERKITFSLKNIMCEVKMKRDKQGTLVVSRLTNLYYDFDLFKLLNYSNFWTFYLTNLKTYAEYGIDLREQDLKEQDINGRSLNGHQLKGQHLYN